MPIIRGLYIGRFQPFHLGHVSAFRKALEQVDELVIVVGSSQTSHSPLNPFTAGERLWMIRSALNEIGLKPQQYWLLALPDLPMNSLWVAHVITYTPPFQIVFSNNPLVGILFKERKFNVVPMPLIERKLYQSTKIRERMVADLDWEALVPKSVVRIIKEVKGVDRLKALIKSDVT